MFLGIGTFLLAMGTLVMLATGSEPTTTTTAPSNEIVVTGETLPPQIEGSLDNAIGMDAPSIRATGLNGEMIEIVPGTKPIVLLFLAHWCAPCLTEVPVVQSYVDEVGIPTDIEFYTILSSNDPERENYPPEVWLENEGWTLPTIRDDESESIITSYGLSGYPHFVVIDPDGTLAARASGGMDRQGLEKLFSDLLEMIGGVGSE